MADRSVDFGTLGTAKARAKFREAHYDFVYQAALGISKSNEVAEKLTEKLFTMMEENFREEKLPYGVELYMLARLHMLYAKDSSVRAKPRPSAAGRTGNASQAAVPEARIIPTEPVKAAPAERREPAPQGMPTPAKKPASGREDPAPNAIQTDAAVGAVSQEPFQPLEPMQPLVVHLPGGTQSYYVSQPFLVQPLYPMTGTSAVVGQAVRPEFQGTAAPLTQTPQQVAEVPPAAGKASYDQTVTEFWTPQMDQIEADKQKSPAAQAQPASSATGAVAPAPTPAATPKSRAAQAASDADNPRMQRSVPLTIVNTFLLLGLLAAIAYLLMEIGLIPKLF